MNNKQLLSKTDPSPSGTLTVQKGKPMIITCTAESASCTAAAAPKKKK